MSGKRRTVPVIVECRLCPFSATGSTWRPVKRVVAEHIAAKHGKAGAV